MWNNYLKYMQRIYRNILFALFLFTVLGVLNSCSKDDEIIVDNSNVEVVVLEPQDIKMWFEYLCSPDLGGRYSGSDGIIKAMNYICDVIGKSDSLEVEHFNINKCEMNNIIFHIKGTNDSLIVLGAHYDAYGYFSHTPLPGADDNMSGTSVLLKLIKYIQNNPFIPNYGIDICLFDGEVNNSFD